jgi:hypothetical protein
VPQSQGHFLYPPLLAVLTMPLVALFPSDYGAAAFAWSAVAAVVRRRACSSWRSPSR